MALMEWSPALSVKVTKFDDQHKKLLELVNQLHDAMKSGQGNNMLGVILQQLVSYTVSHFGEEEKVMQAQGYPDFPAHKAEHEKLIRQVGELQQKFQSGAAMLSMTVMNFLKDWLVNHIQGVDKKYSAHLNGKGIC